MGSPLPDLARVLPSSQLLSRRNALHERAQSRRAALEDSFHLQQFFRDSDELKSWINEKMKTATDEAYKARRSPLAECCLVQQAVLLGAGAVRVPGSHM